MPIDQATEGRGTHRFYVKGIFSLTVCPDGVLVASQHPARRVLHESLCLWPSSSGARVGRVFPGEGVTEVSALMLRPQRLLEFCHLV